MEILLEKTSGAAVDRRSIARRAQLGSGKWARSIILLVLLAQGCARTSLHEPVTLVYLDQRLVNPMYRAEYEKEFEQFTRETGIIVRALPHPESTQDQLAFWQRQLKNGSSGPDVYGIDVVWAGILSDDFIDLKPYFSDEIPAFFPDRFKKLHRGRETPCHPGGLGHRTAFLPQRSAAKVWIPSPARDLG